MMEWDTTWNCQSGRLNDEDPPEGRYDPWEDDYEPPPRYVAAEPYDSAYREKEALEAMGYRVY